MSIEAVKLKGVTKRYGEKVAVEYMNLTIKKEEIFGLLGSNGAGKTTTLHMICGLTPLTSGELTVFGKSYQKERKQIHKALGLVPQELALYPELKAWENIELFASLYGLKGQALKEATERALAFVNLEESRDLLVKNFPSGMKRRLNIACAIAHQPKLLILDEPTVAIDPQSRHFILKQIKKLKEAGTTVVYTSHYMEEVEQLCDRVAIMDKGKIIVCGTKEELVSLVTNEENLPLEEVFLRLTGKRLRDEE